MTDHAMAYWLRKQAERVERMLVPNDEDVEILHQVTVELRAKADEMETEA